MAHTTAKAGFAAKRAHLLPLPGDDYAPPDDEPDDPFCRCGNDLTLEELDRNKCAACGKQLT